MKIEILNAYTQNISLVSLSVAERDVSTLATELPCIFLPSLSHWFPASPPKSERSDARLWPRLVGSRVVWQNIHVFPNLTYMWLSEIHNAFDLGKRGRSWLWRYTEGVFSGETWRPLSDLGHNCNDGPPTVTRKYYQVLPDLWKISNLCHISVGLHCLFPSRSMPFL